MAQTYLPMCMCIRLNTDSVSSLDVAMAVHKGNLRFSSTHGGVLSVVNLNRPDSNLVITIKRVRVLRLSILWGLTSFYPFNIHLFLNNI